jgi:calcium/calmodulin-dependent protein kinase I
MGAKPGKGVVLDPSNQLPESRGRSNTNSKSTSAENVKFEKNAYEKWEIALLEQVFADLLLRSRAASSHCLDKDTFLKFFAHVPGLLAERLFSVFDKENKGEVDQKCFIRGLYRFTRGTEEDCIRFVFEFFDVSNVHKIKHGDLVSVLSALFTAYALFSGLEEHSESELTRMLTEMSNLSNEEEKSSGYSLYVFSKWLTQCPQVLNMLSSVILGQNQTQDDDISNYVNDNKFSLAALMTPRHRAATITPESIVLIPPLTPKGKSAQSGLAPAASIPSSPLKPTSRIVLTCTGCNFKLVVKHCYGCGRSLDGTADNVQCDSCGSIFIKNAIKRCMACGRSFASQTSSGMAEPQLLSLMRVNKKGWLMKRGKTLGQVKTRFSVLVDNFLYLYPDEDSHRSQRKPHSVIFLERVFVESVNRADEKNQKLKFGIEIIISETPRISRFVYAKTASERVEWMKALQEAANVHDINDYYTLGKELGVGRFATVRLGTNKTDGKQYAIKIIDKTLLDEKENEALRTEVAVLKLIRHPHIIQLKNVFETRRQLNIVMAYHTGGDLFDRIQQKQRFPEGTARAFAFNLLSAVGYLHRRGVVHRDLKPENIMMVAPDCRDDEIVVVDFGLSKFANPSEQMALSCGTVAYVAPEVLKNSGYDKGVDLWSIGVILYLSLRGALPFIADDTQEIIRLTIEGKVDFSHSIWNEVSQCAKDLVTSLLRVNPSERLDAEQAIAHQWFSMDIPGFESLRKQPESAPICTNVQSDDEDAEVKGSAEAKCSAAPSVTSSPAQVAGASESAPAAALREDEKAAQQRAQQRARNRRLLEDSDSEIG